MDHQQLKPLLSLIESNKAYLDINKKYLNHYIQGLRSELNKIMELTQQKKEITDQVITLFEGTDTFNTVVNSELFEKVKQEMNGLHETVMDYFMHCFHTQLSTSDDDVENNLNNTNSTEQVENDIQISITDEIDILQARIQHLRDMIDKLDEA